MTTPTEALKIALTLIEQDRRALLESHAYPPGSLTIPANDPAADEALAQHDEAIHAIRSALAQPQPSAPSVEPVAWQNIQFGPGHHVPPTPAPAPTAQPAPAVPLIDYQSLIHAAFARYKYRCGTGACIAFKRGAEWFAEVAAAPQEPQR